MAAAARAGVRGGSISTIALAPATSLAHPQASTFHKEQEVGLKTVGMQGNPLGLCKLCGQRASLCKSHAVPDAFFRMIKKQEGGAAIHLSSDDSKIKRSIASGYSHQLCRPCEGHLNSNFDSPGTNFLKACRQQIEAGRRVMECNTDAIAGFLLAVTWRAAVSEDSMYRYVRFSETASDAVRVSLLAADSGYFRLASYRIRNLVDRTPVDGFGPDALKSFIAPPVTVKKPGPSRPPYVISMVLYGFLIEVTFPSLSPSKRTRPGFLRPKGRALTVPDYNIIDHPLLFGMFVHNYGKMVRGHTTVTA